MLIENGEFALFFRPHRGEFVIQGKKTVDARGLAQVGGGGGGGVGAGAAGGLGGTWAQRELTDTFISKMVVELSKEYSLSCFLKDCRRVT